MRELWRAAAGVTAALSIAACGLGGGGKSAATVSPGGTGGASPARCEDVTIRMAGTQAGAVTALSLVLAEATASGSPDGATLPVAGAPVGTSLDLSAGAAESTLGKFHLPDGDDAFAVSLSFGSGSVVSAGTGASVGPCTNPLSFRFERARLSPERCQVLLLLDLGRSVVPDGSGVALIPQFRVVY